MGGGFPLLKYRDLARILRAGGATFVGYGGRTSHRIWNYPVEDTLVQAVIPAHDEGADVLPVYVRKLRRDWKLTPEDGVSDQDFLTGNWQRSE